VLDDEELLIGLQSPRQKPLAQRPGFSPTDERPSTI